jgi:hypothetical protein
MMIHGRRTSTIQSHAGRLGEQAIRSAPLCLARPHRTAGADMALGLAVPPLLLARTDAVIEGACSLPGSIRPERSIQFFR